MPKTAVEEVKRDEVPLRRSSRLCNSPVPKVVTRTTSEVKSRSRASSVSSDTPTDPTKKRVTRRSSITQETDEPKRPNARGRRSPAPDVAPTTPRRRRRSTSVEEDAKTPLPPIVEERQHTVLTEENNVEDTGQVNIQRTTNQQDIKSQIQYCFVKLLKDAKVEEALKEVVVEPMDCEDFPDDYTYGTPERRKSKRFNLSLSGSTPIVAKSPKKLPESDEKDDPVIVKINGNSNEEKENIETNSNDKEPSLNKSINAEIAEKIPENEPKIVDLTQAAGEAEEKEVANDAENEKSTESSIVVCEENGSDEESEISKNNSTSAEVEKEINETIEIVEITEEESEQKIITDNINDTFNVIVEEIEEVTVVTSTQKTPRRSIGKMRTPKSDKKTTPKSTCSPKQDICSLMDTFIEGKLVPSATQSPESLSDKSVGEKPSENEANVSVNSLESEKNEEVPSEQSNTQTNKILSDSETVRESENEEDLEATQTVPVELDKKESPDKSDEIALVKISFELDDSNDTEINDERLEIVETIEENAENDDQKAEENDGDGAEPNSPPPTPSPEKPKSNRNSILSPEHQRKLDALIDQSSDESDTEKYLNEITEFIDDMAEEGEESTPSVSSNEIVDDGESINSENLVSGNEDEDDDDMSSFIDDEDVDELLSGDDDDHLEKTPTPTKKRSRIIVPSDSSSSEAEEKPELVKKTRTSSITIEDNITVGDVMKESIFERISKMLDVFCEDLDTGTKISLKILLNCTNGEQDECKDSGVKILEQVKIVHTDPDGNMVEYDGEKAAETFVDEVNDEEKEAEVELMAESTPLPKAAKKKSITPKKIEPKASPSIIIDDTPKNKSAEKNKQKQDKKKINTISPLLIKDDSPMKSFEESGKKKNKPKNSPNTAVKLRKSPSAVSSDTSKNEIVESKKTKEKKQKTNTTSLISVTTTSGTQADAQQAKKKKKSKNASKTATDTDNSEVENSPMRRHIISMDHQAVPGQSVMKKRKNLPTENLGIISHDKTNKRKKLSNREPRKTDSLSDDVFLPEIKDKKTNKQKKAKLYKNVLTGSLKEQTLSILNEALLDRKQRQNNPDWNVVPITRKFKPSPPRSDDKHPKIKRLQCSKVGEDGAFTVTKFNPKDYKNRTLYDKKRVRRMNTKDILRKHSSN